MALTDCNQDPVCEICGVEGNRQCLTACCKCGGLQHIYCMHKNMLELPQEWQCDECQEKTQDVLAMKDVNEGVNEFSVCPSKNCFWIGTFMINQESFMDFKCLLKAYTSPTTTKRICEMLSKMSKEIQLTVAARTTMETNMFSDSPTKWDIGLFFFCGDDIECIRYHQILEHLNTNDCIMRGLINNNMELIVLSSKLLPLGSQYWLGRPFMWAIFQRIKTYEKICEYNATVVEPDPMFFIGMKKKKSSRVGPDPVPITGRIKINSSRVGKKGSSHPPPLALTPTMNYVTPPTNMVQPDLLVQPYPVPVTHSTKKESSQVRLDVVHVIGRIKRKSSQVEKKGSYLLPPPMPSTPVMNYVAPPPTSVLNVDQSDPMSVIGRNMNVVQPDRVPVTRKIKKKSYRVGKKSSSISPLPPTSAINDIVPPSLMPAINVVQSHSIPVIGKNMNVVQPDPVPVIGKNKKKSYRIREMGSLLPTSLSPAPDINYVAPPTPPINNVAAPVHLPPFHSTPIINYIISGPRIGNREARRGNRNCWDQNRMA